MQVSPAVDEGTLWCAVSEVLSRRVGAPVLDDGGGEGICWASPLRSACAF